jgi:hypothetical protein
LFKKNNGKIWPIITIGFNSSREICSIIPVRHIATIWEEMRFFAIFNVYNTDNIGKIYGLRYIYLAEKIIENTTNATTASGTYLFRTQLIPLFSFG